MFGNFARWNEPSRDSGSSQDPGPGNPGNPGNPGYPVSGLMSSSQSKKADYKVVNASPDFESSSPQRYPSSLVFESSMEILGCLFSNLKNNHTIGHLRVKGIRSKFTRALTKYKRPKMKRDAQQKCSFFQKKTAFCISFHFQPFVFC